MKADYLKFVQWSAVDRLFVGYCPDLFLGGVCHGSDEQKVYRELSRLVAEEIAESARNRRALPRKTGSRGHAGQDMTVCLTAKKKIRAPGLKQ